MGQVLGLLTKLKQICNHPALALKEGGNRRRVQRPLRQAAAAGRNR